MASGYRPGTTFTGPLRNTDNRQSAPRAWYGQLPFAVEPTVAESFNDFILPSSYSAGDWTVTSTGSEAIDDTVPWGVLTVTTGAVSTNTEKLQRADSFWATQTGQRLWYRTRVKLDASQATVDLRLGLETTAGTDAIEFRVVNGSANIECVCQSSSTGLTTTVIPSVGNADQPSLVGEFVDLAWVWDGNSGSAFTASRVDFYINDQRVASINSNIPLATAALRPTIVLTTHTAAARSLQTDYLLVAQQRQVQGRDQADLE
jgi:hypothetical protein